MIHRSSFRWIGYAGAVSAVAVAAVLRQFLHPYLAENLPYAFFILAVAIAAWVGGIGPAVLSVVLSSAVADYFFTFPRYSFAIADVGEGISLGFFLLTSALIIVLTEIVQRSIRRSQEAADQLVRHEQAARRRSDEAARQLALLVEASANLTSSLDPQIVLSSIVELSERLVAADAYAIWRLKPDTGEWSIAASSGLSEEYQHTILQTMNGTPQMPDRTLVAEDVSELSLLSQRQDDYRREGVRSMVIAPLRIRGQVCGTLVLYYRSPRRFEDVEITMASALANLAASAIGSADLYDQERRAQEDRVRLIQQLEEADRRKDDFLAMLAHELRNPLAAIRYAIEVAQISPSSDGEVTEIIDHQTRQLSHLIDDLLDVSRITRGKIQLKRQPVDAAEIVDQAVAAIRPSIEHRRHELLVDKADEPMPLFGDPTRLEQVLVNLLTNAVKYTPEGGAIRVAAERDGEHVVFRIRDNGMGIPQESLPRIFELFSQADRSLDRAQGGLGIGLTVVRSLVEMHGGEVLATSDGPGSGAEFVVRLPRAGECDVPASTVELPDEEAHESVRVLLVEDSDSAAEMLRMLLTSQGHTVEVAADGLQAVRVASGFRPDVVLLDIGLPGLDGYRVAERLRNDNVTKDVTIIGLSGYGQDRDRARSSEAGFDYHLVKPVEFSKLAPLLRTRQATIGK